MPPPFAPKTLASKSIFKGGTIPQVNITAYFTGTITLHITADAGSATPTWDVVTLVSGTKKEHTFTVAGNDIRYIAFGSFGAELYVPTNDFGKATAPLINIEATYQT